MFVCVCQKESVCKLIQHIKIKGHKPSISKPVFITFTIFTRLNISEVVVVYVCVWDACVCMLCASQSSIQRAREQVSVERCVCMCACVCACMHGFEVSPQLRYNYMEMCSIWLHLSGTCHIHIAVIAIVTKRSLYEYHSLKAFMQLKPGLLKD